MAGRVSELTAGTPPYALTSLLEISVPDGGAPSGYLTRSATLDDLIGSASAADLSNGVTGSGAIVLANSPSLVTPALGAATGTSVVLSGQGNRLGSNAGSAASPTNANTNLLLYNGSATNYAGIGADAAGGVYIVAGTSAPATRVFITPGGNVGIGTTSPLLPMDVAGGALRVRGTTSPATGSGAEVHYSGGIGYFTAFSDRALGTYAPTVVEGSDVRLKVSGAEKVRIGSTGLQHLGSTSGSVTINVPAVAGSNTLTLPAGTTDFSATGGAGQFVKQNSAGGAFTVAAVQASELSGLGANVATFLGTPNSANLAAAVTNETGSGSLVFGTSPVISDPTINGVSSLVSTSAGAETTPLVVRNRDNTASTAVSVGFNAHGTLSVITGKITNLKPGLTNDFPLIFYTWGPGAALTEKMKIFGTGDLRQGTGSAIATTATDGFFLISTCAGVPTGVPTNAGAGQIPLVYDKTNNKLYAYNGGWKASGAFA